MGLEPILRSMVPLTDGYEQLREEYESPGHFRISSADQNVGQRRDWERDGLNSWEGGASRIGLAKDLPGSKIDLANVLLCGA